MLDVLRFCLDRGVDGFRVDVIWHLIKDESFSDNPPNPEWHEGIDPYRAIVPLYTTDRPEVHQVIALMRRVVDSYPNRVLIGEIYLSIERRPIVIGIVGSFEPIEGAGNVLAYLRRSPQDSSRFFVALNLRSYCAASPRCAALLCVD
jgi:hypothetical protein